MKRSTGAVRFRFEGDTVAAQQLTGQARALLGSVKSRKQRFSAPSGRRTFALGGGKTASIESLQGIDTITIFVPFDKEEVKKALEPDLILCGGRTLRNWLEELYGHQDGVIVEIIDDGFSKAVIVDGPNERGDLTRTTSLSPLVPVWGCDATEASCFFFGLGYSWEERATVHDLAVREMGLIAENYKLEAWECPEEEEEEEEWPEEPPTPEPPEPPEPGPRPGGGPGCADCQAIIDDFLSDWADFQYNPITGAWNQKYVTVAWAGPFLIIRQIYEGETYACHYANDPPCVGPFNHYSSLVYVWGNYMGQCVFLGEAIERYLVYTGEEGYGPGIPGIMARAHEEYPGYTWPSDVCAPTS